MTEIAFSAPWTVARAIAQIAEQQAARSARKFPANEVWAHAIQRYCDLYRADPFFNQRKARFSARMRDQERRTLARLDGKPDPEPESAAFQIPQFPYGLLWTQSTSNDEGTKKVSLRHPQQLLELVEEVARCEGVGSQEILGRAGRDFVEQYDKAEDKAALFTDDLQHTRQPRAAGPMVRALPSSALGSYALPPGATRPGAPAFRLPL